ncbi:MAG TPA: sigma 54-interacting transcriptional regulator, partial [Candidatus Sabulitectum sp.]|nr:sigma 54-interacting transcriptional regulator [Candidatus Sabulitectum sp.]
LQDRTVTPLGSSEPLQVEARVICATNCDLESMVETGRFRSDLYYRINVVRLVIPPLRERPEDIPELFQSLLDKHCGEQGMDNPGFDPAILPVLAGHSWPGNVRELENLVERALLLTSGERIGLADLPEAIAPLGKTPKGTIRSARMEAERQTILAALAGNGNSRTAAARELGIHKTTLYRRMRALGIPLPEDDGRSGNAT